MAKFLPCLDNQTVFQLDFMPLLMAAVTDLQSQVMALHSIYLNGSIAYRQATNGISDLNLTVVITASLTVEEQHRIAIVCQDLKRHYSVISNVDITWLLLDDVLSITAIFKWGFWLKHCSVCLYGTNLGEQFGNFEPCWEIAKVFNDDIAAFLVCTQQQIKRTKSAIEYQDYCRRAGKKMLRSCFMLVAYRSDDWAYTDQQCADFFLAFYPDKAIDIERLFVLINGPQVPKKASLFMVSQFGGWIVNEFNHIERKIG
ncbi:nucleotidyltransferase domain-containing protein [Photobacterium phosphoreum]|uniref:nucleotidyltransferase domain-containing protein n=1 Tax=Photobacterium phosphoreum TaxID=659 RepID=UPI001EFDF791|nr:nucleotidyltransferase domain-containing protein [Photobacterium phosphoreum]